MTTTAGMVREKAWRPEDVMRAVRAYQEHMEPIVRAHCRLLAMLPPAQLLVRLDEAGNVVGFLRQPDPLELTIIEQHQKFAREVAKLYGLGEWMSHNIEAQQD